MIGRFSFELERTQPVSLLRARGVLDAYTAADLRGAMVECLTEQPAGVLIDVSDLALADDVALTVLASTARESLRWPGTRFALGGANRHFAASVDRLGVSRYVTVCPDRASALLELGRWPVPPSRRRRLTPDQFAPGLARDAVRDFCDECRVRDGDAAQLVASELVTNAVLHARTAIDLTLRFVPPYLQISVRDGGPGEVRLAENVDEFSQNGRGLLLVDALATAWGSLFPSAGKIVWATVRVRSIPQGSERTNGPPE